MINPILNQRRILQWKTKTKVKLETYKVVENVSKSKHLSKGVILDVFA